MTEEHDLYETKLLIFFTNMHNMASTSEWQAFQRFARNPFLDAEYRQTFFVSREKTKTNDSNI